jgi:hypothetical protein
VEPALQRNAAGVEADVREKLPDLPETFTRNDVCRALGYIPYRGALYGTLQKLVKEGRARVLEPGSGHRATVYQKTGDPSAEARPGT